MVHPPAAGIALRLALSTAVLLIAPAVGQAQPHRWRELTVPSSGVAVYHGDRARVVLATNWRSLEEDVSTCEWDGSAWLMRNARTQLSHRDQFGLAPSPSGSLLLFGGSVASQFLAETWEWDGEDWRRLSTATRPSARRLPAMAFDARRGRTVLFGGTTASNVQLTETWEWDGSNWLLRPTAISPPPGYIFAMAFDARRGVTVLATSAPSGPVQTWEWDGVQWSQRTPANPPTATDVQAMCYDARRGVCLMVQAASTWPYRDISTWQWDGTTWTALGVIQARLQTWPSLAYDEERGVPVLVTSGAGETPSVLEWDGLTWRETVRAQVVPHFLCIPPTGAYDVLRGRTVLLSPVPDLATWEWDGQTWTRFVTTPTPRALGAAMTHDLARGRTMLFGGSDGSGGYLAETWEWDGTRWTRRFVTGPSPRTAPLAYDLARGRTVLFGGLNLTGGLSDTWEWDGTVWTQAQPTSRPPGGRHSLAFDVARGRTMCLATTQAGGLELWEWDGLTWTNRTSPVMPLARGDASLTYDWARRRLLLFGGRYFVGSGGGWYTVSLNDLWEWDGSTWQALALTSPTTPSPRHSSLLVYDTRRGRAVLFGGCEDRSNSEVGIQRNRGDTWELGPDPEAATLAFGRACRGSVGYATISTAERPVPGNAAFALRLAGLPAWAPIALVVGARSTHQPLGADCSLWVATWLAVLASRSDGVGTGAFPLAIPANPALLGATLSTQGAAGDSAAPTGVVWTGGLQVRIGW